MTVSTWKRNPALIIFAALGLAGAAVTSVLTIRERRRVEAIVKELEQESLPRETFATDSVAGLPGPAQRYFLHALRPGARLPRVARLTMWGQIKPSEQLGWCPFTASQVIASDRGFIWRASVRAKMAVLTGVDQYLNGSGRMRISLFGLIPVVDEATPDVARSALGRFFIECVWLPSALLPDAGARIEPVDNHRFAVTKTIDGEEARVILTVDDEGRVLQLQSLRWGNQTESRVHEMIPFGGFVHAERAFGDCVVPSEVSVGWWFGTPKYADSFRATIEAVDYDAS